MKPDAIEPFTEQSEHTFPRWAHVVIPLSALLLVAGTYFVAAEVLTRIA